MWHLSTGIATKNRVVSLNASNKTGHLTAMDNVKYMDNVYTLFCIT